MTVKMYDIYLDDGTHLTALADFEERLREMRSYLNSIDIDIQHSLADKNGLIAHQFISNAESVCSDAQCALTFDFDKIRQDVELYHKHRLVEILKERS
jgi:hypothetical protein